MTDNERLSDIAEEITDKVFNMLAPTVPVWVHDGSNDPEAVTYSDEPRDVYIAVLEILESNARD